MKEIDYGSVRLKVDEVMSSQGISINKLAFRAEMERTQLNSTFPTS